MNGANFIGVFVVRKKLSQNRLRETHIPTGSPTYGRLNAAPYDVPLRITMLGFPWCFDQKNGFEHNLAKLNIILRI